MQIVKNDNKLFEMSIEDNGVGIPKDKIENIFDRFFTEGSGNKTNEILRVPVLDWH